MRRRYPTMLFVLMALVECRGVHAAGPFPRLLPPAEELRLSLKEAPQSTLPLGQSCGGEASLTLLCRAFIVTLENGSTNTIRISGIECFEPSINFELKDPKSSTGWWPVSQPGKPTCDALDWTNTRLRPGERLQYATRLITPRRSILYVGPGNYTMRAQWTLFGCTDGPEGEDCLTPLQDVYKVGSAAKVGAQEPVTVYSNEVMTESPELGELGGLKFGFEVTEVANQVGDTKAARYADCTVERTSVECAVFHYVIRNLGDRPVRNARFSCSDSSITPEYSFEGSAWTQVPSTAWVCSMNILVETEILPGGKVEGSFTLKSLLPGYDTSFLQAPGEYRLRFRFSPQACIASPEASFCLARPKEQPSVASKVLTLRSLKADAVNK
jgi:hypothetical protein